MNDARSDMPDRLEKTGRRRSGWAMRWQIPVFILALLAWTGFVWLGHERKVTEREDARAAVRRMIASCKGGEDGKVVGEVPVPREVWIDEARGMLDRALAAGLERDQVLDAKEALMRCCVAMEDYREALTVLREIEAEFPKRGQDLLLLRARSGFRLGKADEGERSIGAYLGLPGLTDVEKAEAYLEAGEGYRVNGRLAEAERSFRRLISEFPQSRKGKAARFGLGLTLMEKAQGNAAPLQEAREEFEKAVKALPVQAEMDRQARFLAGECLYREEDYEGAVRVLGEVAAGYGGSAEGVAAALRLAAIHVSRHEFEAAREALGRVLAEMSTGGRLVNPYVSAPEINSIWGVMLRHYLTQEECGELERLNRDAPEVARRDVYLYQQARVYRHCAQELRTDAERLRADRFPKEATLKDQEARLNFRRAGQLFARIVNGVESDLTLSTEALQQAADCLLEAGDYPEAVVYYRLILKSSGGETDVPQTQVRYAKALQAMGRHEEARRKLEDCVSSCGSGNPSVYEAKLARTESHIAMGDLGNAEKSLSEIVCHGDVFSPTGKVWRQALTELGYVLYCRGKFREAAEKLDEVLTRKGALESSRFSRTEITYYLADAHRNVGSTEPRARRAELRHAADGFAQVTEADPDDGLETSLSTLMKRRSRLGEADCRYELGEYERALVLYQSAAERYLDREEGVAAIFGVAACLHRLGRDKPAAEAADLARWSLERLKRDRPETVTSFLEDSCGTMAAWHAEGANP